MRRRYKAGLGLAAVGAGMGAGYLAGKKMESRKSVVHRIKDALNELRD